MAASSGLWPLFSAIGAALLGLLGGWLGAYFKVKGENLARREDLEHTVDELKQQTRAIEAIKEDIEDRSRRTEHAAEYIERQIKEFYGPIFNLVHQVVVANHVQHAILEQKQESDQAPSSDQRADVVRFFQEHYFFPLHEEVNSILKTKLYLIEGTALPHTYYLYLRHALQEQAQARLWAGKKIDTSYVRGLPYPNDLYETVKRDLDSLMLRYRKLTRPEEDSKTDPARVSAFEGRFDLS